MGDLLSPSKSFRKYLPLPPHDPHGSSTWGFVPLYTRHYGLFMDSVSSEKPRLCMVNEDGDILIYMKEDAGYFVRPSDSESAVASLDFIRVSGRVQRLCRVKLRFKFGTITLTLLGESQIVLWTKAMMKSLEVEEEREVHTANLVTELATAMSETTFSLVEATEESPFTGKERGTASSLSTATPPSPLPFHSTRPPHRTSQVGVIVGPRAPGHVFHFVTPTVENSSPLPPLGSPSSITSRINSPTHAHLEKEKEEIEEEEEEMEKGTPENIRRGLAIQRREDRFLEFLEKKVGDEEEIDYEDLGYFGSYWGQLRTNKLLDIFLDKEEKKEKEEKERKEKEENEKEKDSHQASSTLPYYQGGRSLSRLPHEDSSTVDVEPRSIETGGVSPRVEEAAKHSVSVEQRRKELEGKIREMEKAPPMPRRGNTMPRARRHQTTVLFEGGKEGARTFPRVSKIPRPPLLLSPRVEE